MNEVRIVLCICSGTVEDLAVFEDIEDAEAYALKAVEDYGIDHEDEDCAEDCGDIMHYHSEDYECEVILHRHEPIRQNTEAYTPDYEKGFGILIDYWDSLPDIDKPDLDKKLKELRL